MKIASVLLIIAICFTSAGLDHNFPKYASDIAWFFGIIVGLISCKFLGLFNDSQS